MILNKDKEVAGTAVVVRWEPPLERACPVMSYKVYYGEMFSQVEKVHSNMVNVSRNATSFTLQLNCGKEYEIAVTSLNNHGESDLKDSRTWRFKTPGGNKVLFAAYALENRLLCDLLRLTALTESTVSNQWEACETFRN